MVLQSPNAQRLVFTYGGQSQVLCELCAAWKLPGLLLWGPAVAATAGVVQAETLSWLEPGSWLRNGPKLQGKPPAVKSPLSLPIFSKTEPFASQPWLL